jgi:hypothetical protein
MLIKIIHSQFIRCMLINLLHLKFTDAWHALLLRHRYIKFKKELNKFGGCCDLNQQYRDRKSAHTWSTAYHIINGKITMGSLRKLTNGRDKDGNLWYTREWDNGVDDYEAANTASNILENAMTKAASNFSYAEEGYPPDSPYRLPNLTQIPVSKHVNGMAIDIDIDWDRIGGEDTQFLNNLLTSFGLKRPIKDEAWHLELLL